MRHTEHVGQYEDELNQTLAASVIPVEVLMTKATLDNSGKVNEYELAKQLLNWFHSSFFKWVDRASCELCGSNETKAGDDGKV